MDFKNYKSTINLKQDLMMLNETIILLVDTSKTLQLALERFFDGLFTASRYRLIHVMSVQESLQILKRNNVDLIITDLKLLDRSGISLLIQARETFPKIPIIVLSAYTDLVTKEDLVLLGVSYFFQKPSDLQQIKQAISEILQIEKH